jgi:hypothetical protein
MTCCPVGNRGKNIEMRNREIGEKHRIVKYMNFVKTSV